MTDSAAGESSRRRRARIVLALGALLGLGYLGYRAVVAPWGASINFDVYRAAAVELWTGGPVYGVSPVGDPAYTFRYPPITLAWFSLYLLVSPLLGYLLHLVSTLAVSAVVGYVLVAEIGRHGVTVGPLDRVLAIGFVAVGSYGAPSLLYGNVNHHLALAVGLGLVWLARGRQTRAGVALGLGALLKVFPAGIGLWLCRRRAWRALGAAIATGLGGLLMGAVAFGPDRTVAFVDAELLSRATPASIADGISPESTYVTLARPLSALLPVDSLAVLSLLAAVLVAPVLAVLYRDVSTPTDSLIGVFGTLAALLLVLPSFSLYFLVLSYPLVVLLYVLDGGPGRLFAAGAGISLLTLDLPDAVMVLDAIPVPSVVSGVTHASARAIYTFGTPVLWGTLVMLAACLWHTTRSAGTG